VIPKVNGIAFTPSSVVGGKSVVATLHLTTAAPAGGLVVTLSTSSSVLKAPAERYGSSRGDYGQCYADHHGCDYVDHGQSLCDDECQRDLDLDQFGRRGGIATSIGNKATVEKPEGCGRLHRGFVGL